MSERKPLCTVMSRAEVLDFMQQHRFCSGGYCKCGLDLHGSGNARVTQWVEHVRGLLFEDQERA